MRQVRFKSGEKSKRKTKKQETKQEKNKEKKRKMDTTCIKSLAIAAGCGFAAGVVLTALVCRLKCRYKAHGAKGGDRRQGRKPERIQKLHPAPADGSVEIYVGNLSYEMNDEQLNKEFAAFGQVNSARIIVNRFNGRSKGFGFVHMPNRAEAEAAIKALNDKEILGRRLKCNEAKNVEA